MLMYLNPDGAINRDHGWMEGDSFAPVHHSPRTVAWAKARKYVLVRTHHTPEGSIDSVEVAKLIDEGLAA